MRVFPTPKRYKGTEMLNTKTITLYPSKQRKDWWWREGSERQIVARPTCLKPKCRLLGDWPTKCAEQCRSILTEFPKNDLRKAFPKPNSLSDTDVPIQKFGATARFANA